MHHTGNTRCKTQATQGNRLTFCHSEGSAHKLATLGLLPNARRARCLAPTARRLLMGCWRAPSSRAKAPPSLNHGGACAPRFPCEPKAACPPRALPPAPAAIQPLHPSACRSLLPPPGLRERSRTGQRTLSLGRRVAGALLQRLRLLIKESGSGIMVFCVDAQ